MAQKRYFNSNFWKDSYVVDLDPIEKLIFNYLFTNMNCNIAGIYETTIREIAFDTGIDRDMVSKILGRFQNDDKLTYRDGWVFMHNGAKNQALNPSVKLGIHRIYDTLPTWLQEIVEATWVGNETKKLIEVDDDK